MVTSLSLAIYFVPNHQQYLLSLLFTPFGCLARWRLMDKYNKKVPGFPLGTFCCNVGGCALSGSLASFLAGEPCAYVVGMYYHCLYTHLIPNFIIFIQVTRVLKKALCWLQWSPGLLVHWVLLLHSSLVCSLTHTTLTYPIYFKIWYLVILTLCLLLVRNLISHRPTYLQVRWYSLRHDYNLVGSHYWLSGVTSQEFCRWNMILQLSCSNP